MVATYTQSLTTVENVKRTLPDIGSASTITSEQIAHFIGEAEAYINASIAHRYTVPVKKDVPLLTQIATDLAIYRMLSRKVLKIPRASDEEWLDRYKESVSVLQQVARGEITLIDTSGNVLEQRTDVLPLDSNNRTYLPTFHEGDWTDMVQDEDKIDDTLDERGL